MAKFRFKLESLLKHRSDIERQKQQELARAQSRMNELHAELFAAEQSIRDAASGEIDAHQRRFLDSMRRKSLATKQQLAELEKVRDAARIVFATAAKERKAIELLREKEFIEWHKQQAAVEQWQIDEAAARLDSGYDPAR
jgi:flagellar export protein FliJ